MSYKIGSIEAMKREPSLTPPEPFDYSDAKEMAQEAANCNNIEPDAEICSNCHFIECDTRVED